MVNQVYHVIRISRAPTIPPSVQSRRSEGSKTAFSAFSKMAQNRHFSDLKIEGIRYI
jgi:hypothetical protein